MTKTHLYELILGLVSAGKLNTVTGTAAIAFGISNTVTGDAAIGLGNWNTADGNYGLAIGYNNIATGVVSLALGQAAVTRIQRTTNICPPIINRKDDGESSAIAWESFCGVEVVIMSKEIDLEAVADQTINLYSGCRFFVNEVGLIVTSANTVTDQPTVRAGYTGTLAGLLAAVQTTGLTAAGHRQRFTTMVTSAGQTTLTAGVTVVATATTMLGRFYWKGLLVENE
ncbi:hypothetical protein LCGC14_0705780 [marine sediment metagenome]|uniref:Uncharacterized protein n=1 Tax=marine sediment metagenome TaxID=412755 RepID=A0A0F9R1Y4_9ZZZZ|nr:hypothetical protein [bacterium]